MPSLWFFGLLNLPYSLRSSSNISEKSFPATTSMNTYMHTHIHILTHSCIHTCMHTHLATPKLYSADLYHCIYHTMLPLYVITVSIRLTRLSAPIVKVYYTFILILRHLALCLASSWLSINNYWSIILTSLRFKLGKSLL